MDHLLLGQEYYPEKDREAVLEVVPNQPLYSMGVISELLNVHPETIRVWERQELLLPPQRRGGKRLFSENDLKRLQFIISLTREGLNIPAIRHYLRLYPCWHVDDCDGPTYSSEKNGNGKPCWRKAGTVCQVCSSEDPCTGCKFRHHHEDSEKTAINQPAETSSVEQRY